MAIEKSLQLALELANSNFLELQKTSKQQRNDFIAQMAKTLTQSFDQILEANTLDLVEAREMVRPDLVVHWLKLTPERLSKTVKILEAIAKLNEPLDRRVYRLQQQYNLPQSYCRATPLGVILYIGEAFPELGLIIAAMAIKTCNSIILRGTGESTRTNEAIANIFQSALVKTKLPIHVIQNFSPDQGNFVQDLVTQDQYIQMVIPYGRPSLVKNVYHLSTIPTLFCVMGNCYLYYCNSGDLDLVQEIIVDSHSSQPDPVNAIEKVVIEANYKSHSLIKLWKNLEQEGFKLKGDPKLVEEFPEYLSPVNPDEWDQPYLTPTIAFKLVENLEQGIDFINQHSTGHTNCIVTDSYEISRHFAQDIQSIFTYINCSPKFVRLSDNEESVYFGIAKQKDGRRGLISLESLTTIRQVIQGIS